MTSIDSITLEVADPNGAGDAGAFTDPDGFAWAPAADRALTASPTAA